MTNEEAKCYIRTLLEVGGCDGFDYKQKEALEMAIKALEQQPSEDCISRQAVIILIDEASEMHPYKVVGDSDTYSNYNQGWSDACDWLYANIEGVPSVIPQIQPNSNEFFNFDAPMVKKSDAVSREAVIKNIKGWFDKIELNPDILIDSIVTLPSVTPKYTDEEIDKAQAVEQAYVDKMVELAVEEIKRPKGKWIKCKSRFGVAYFKCSECGRKLNWIDRDDNYCNDCGSDNSESTKEWFKEWDTKLAEMSGGGEE